MDRSAHATTLVSIGVGAVATLVDLVVLTLLVEVVGLPPAAANVPALALGLVTQFVGNKWLAFRDPSHAWLQQGAAFLAVEAGAFLLNALGFAAALALSVPYLPARILSQALVYLGFSLPCWRRIFTVRRT